MKNKILIWTLACIIGCGFWTEAAMARNPRSIFKGEPHDKFGSNSLAYSFFPLVNNGFGIEYDRLLTPRTGRHWLKIAPTYYTTISYSTLRKSDITFLRGFSVGVYHRYNYYEIEHVGFQLFLQWGLNYEQNRLRAQNQTQTDIQKLGLDIVMGFRQMIVRPLYFDFTIGYGNRFLLDKTYSVTGGDATQSATPASLESSAYNAHMFDYGYGGPALSINLTLGFVF